MLKLFMVAPLGGFYEPCSAPSGKVTELLAVLVKLCYSLISAIGPNDPEKLVAADDNGGDGRNAKIERVLFPDSDYYVLIRTFDSDGGEFRLSITAT